MVDELLPTLVQLAASNPLLPVLFALIIFLSPLVFLRLLSSLPRPRMVLESLGFGSIFGWSQQHGTRDASPEKEKRKLRKKMRHSRSKSEDSAVLNGDAIGDVYPGLVNVSGTYCFMNSTLQAMASLSYLKPQLDELHARAVELDVPSPVIDAVRDTLKTLNTPHHSRRALRPMAVIDVLSNPAPGQKTSMLFNSHQHQDAQELFQLVSECLKDEALAIDKEASDRLLGLAGVLNDARAPASKPNGVFDGLTANRRSCVDCGYTEAVMHFAFDNWTLAVPRASNCRLEECLADYTRLEVLTDCICRKCSILATQSRLKRDIAKLASVQSPSTNKKKRLRELRKFESLVSTAIAEGRIEDEIVGLKMERVFASSSTKQAMIARPPAVLALHLNRSLHFGYGGAGKNPCAVIFGEYLDLTPFTTSGQLSTRPEAPISAHGNGRSTTPTPANSAVARVVYRLQAVVCHYGAHSFGHYVAYRRKPTHGTPVPPRMPPVLPHSTSGVMGVGKPWLHPTSNDSAPWLNPDPSSEQEDERWLRISDDSVEDVPLSRVLAEAQGTFMLYYERIPQPSLPVPRRHQDSEETLRPVKAALESTDALVSVKQEEHTPELGVGVGVGGLERARSVARVVHAYERGRASRSPSIFGSGSVPSAGAVGLAEPDNGERDLHHEEDGRVGEGEEPVASASSPAPVAIEPDAEPEAMDDTTGAQQRPQPVDADAEHATEDVPTVETDVPQLAALEPSPVDVDTQDDRPPLSPSLLPNGLTPHDPLLDPPPHVDLDIDHDEPEHSPVAPSSSAGSTGTGGSRKRGGGGKRKGKVKQQQHALQAVDLRA